MKQKLTESITTDEILDNQLSSIPKTLVPMHRFVLDYVAPDSRLARRIKAGKTNGKKYKHITI